MFRFTDAKTDAPVTDLQRYLGAWGHLLILSEDMTEYVHAHPREETQPDPNAGPTGGPEVIFDALLPKPGRYRAWLQFQRNDRVVDGVVYIRGTAARRDVAASTVQVVS